MTHWGNDSEEVDFPIRDAKPQNLFRPFWTLPFGFFRQKKSLLRNTSSLRDYPHRIVLF